MTRRTSAWWTAISGAVAGVLALLIAIFLTVGGFSPDPFGMALIVAGISLIAGVNARAVARALSPAARALVEATEDP